MPRYVVLRHVMPPELERGLHYDLMLEQDGKLLTWAIVERPRGGLKIAATKLPDHRLIYLDYEGPIAGNRGDVTRVDAGEYVCSQLDETAANFALSTSNGVLHVELRHAAENQWIAEFSSR